MKRQDTIRQRKELHQRRQDGSATERAIAAGAAAAATLTVLAFVTLVLLPPLETSSANAIAVAEANPDRIA